MAEENFSSLTSGRSTLGRSALLKRRQNTAEADGTLLGGRGTDPTTCTSETGLVLIGLLSGMNKTTDQRFKHKDAQKKCHECLKQGASKRIVFALMLR